jgi:type IV secretory pathway ATPase VirB11/archaellum biosynthesis ATPase
MDPILSIVEQSNQRGNRMLSVIDLLLADTLTRNQAAWLLSRIESGSSWLVGAKPGGAGKTTIMSAFLAMLPDKSNAFVTNSNAWKKARPDDCIVCYEISPGKYDGYIWGDEVRLLTEKGKAGCRIVANLHADTIEDARSQIVDDCRATEEGFLSFDIFLPISINQTKTSIIRTIKEIQYIDDGRWKILQADPALTDRENHIAEFLDECKEKKIITVEAVRKAWLEFLRAR